LRLASEVGALTALLRVLNAGTLSGLGRLSVGLIASEDIERQTK
jgi:hypothetical protein